MSISRIGEIQAKEGFGEELREFLISIIPGIKASEGCESVHLHQSQDDPAKFMMIEVKNIPPEKLEEIIPLIATSPSGSYYELVR
jgi:hypothetical protein